jgi:hypothetical protein
MKYFSGIAFSAWQTRCEHLNEFVLSYKYIKLRNCGTLAMLRAAKKPPSLEKLWQPVERFDDAMPPLKARGDRPLKLTFEHQHPGAQFRSAYAPYQGSH